MRTITVALISILMLTSCERKTSDPGSSVFTVIDDGNVYSDTLISFNKGFIIGHALTKPTLEKGTALGLGSASSSHTTLSGNILLRDTVTGTHFLCSLHKTNNGSFLSLDYQLRTFSSISFTNIPGPANGIGIFSEKNKRQNVAETNGSEIDSFRENFSGGQKYAVDSILLDIDKATGSSIAGSYKLWLTNASGSKTVTGKLCCNNARLD